MNQKIIFIAILCIYAVESISQSIQANKPKSCLGETISVNWAQSPFPISIQWNFGNDASPATGSGSGNAIFQVQYSSPGTKTITATATFAGGLVRTETLNIQVSQLLESYVSRSFRFHPSATMILNASANVTNPLSLAPYKYQWIVDTSTSSFSPQNAHYFYTFTTTDSHNVSLIVEDDGGCRVQIDTTVTTVNVFKAPNIFTPNQDGVNDLFIVESPGNITYTLEIYDRWGSLVYKPNLKGTQLTWDGRNNAGELVAPGVYFYVITPVDSSIEPLRGFVHVYHNEK
ncbi:MAG TPA: gliding motility-associated C-terminal domain-containing protein [Salinivirgaceae bacterium]|nr:gliding motility-associated C-terminal domain-containing protein [Salinivirgaceae bacterium]